MSRQNDIDRTLVRTARALLDWTQPDLAKAAGIALATLKRFEKGHRTPIPVVRAAIFAALEKGGVQFQDDGNRIGVRISSRKLAKLGGKSQELRSALTNRGGLPD
jgi:DNA-binding XRE family transcriptional regulator